ncbi:MAG: tetratricopeptide repeat protein [Myxococcales bacterium]|jgi:tetratricopeptide (TPR) repeat protein|nr:tetratricopeptide repeat protein [Myxococcales bacterium]
MGRFFNREAAVVALILLVAGVAVALLVDVQLWIKLLIPLATLAILHWPMTILSQEKFLSFYIDHGRYARALDLALAIRESSPDRRSRQRASLSVAFVQMASGDYENALKNLRTIVATKEQVALKSVVGGTTGYCLAQLGRDLPEAERLIKASLATQPEEGIFVTFLALVRLQQGRFVEAGELLDKSLALEPDPKLPHLGERSYMKALVFEGLGDLAKRDEQLRLAPNERFLFGRKAREKLNGVRTETSPAEAIGSLESTQGALAEPPPALALPAEVADTAEPGAPESERSNASGANDCLALPAGAAETAEPEAAPPAASDKGDASDSRQAAS